MAGDMRQANSHMQIQCARRGTGGQCCVRLHDDAEDGMGCGCRFSWDLLSPIYSVGAS